jgi:hypothetical protein
LELDQSLSLQSSQSRKRSHTFYTEQRDSMATDDVIATMQVKLGKLDENIQGIAAGMSQLVQH